MLDRKTPPPFVQHTSLQLLKPEIQHLKNGGRIFFIEGGEQEVLKVECVFQAGKWFEPEPGVSHFTSSLLTRGTASRSSLEISNQFDFYGIHTETLPGFDFSSFSLYGLTRNFPPVLDLVIDIISGASFPEKELLQAKDIFIQGLKINLEKTSYLASRQFRKVMFGEAHPYGYDIEEPNAHNLHRNQLIDFRDRYFRDFTVYVSGKLTSPVKDELYRAFARLPYSPVQPQAQITIPEDEVTQMVDKEGSVQASLRIGKGSVGRNHPDYAGLLLLNHILGGFFGSRLMKNIREEKGLTYGIHSSIHALKHASYFVVGADVNRENRETAIDEIKKEFARLRHESISPEELETARNHFIGSIQSELNTPFAHADKIKLIDLFGLHEEYFTQLIHSMVAITPAQLLQLANRHLHEKGMVTVSVG